MLGVYDWEDDYGQVQGGVGMHSGGSMDISGPDRCRCTTRLKYFTNKHISILTLQPRNFISGSRRDTLRCLPTVRYDALPPTKSSVAALLGQKP
jgi:hypothetical protein